ncbi:tetratricopeptide repeat protein [Catenulispora sp. NL8]|uniref:Tetratricopeptide repeat protein n=1 Tax=Catenulispora pinistramenti TaxID=2705254 RepID=A0ABS5KP55_9ACTN|nr:AfsR/SARP family transcriptional regulator [Catenulispora pinistramenti]MBS2547843.1 tetratricopeptide repeat protein [Catenulispora pinistramenti]
MTAGDGPGELAFNILGSFECLFRGAEIPLRGPLQERLAVYLLLNHERVVPVSRLVETIWDDGGPDTAHHQVRKMVSDLRRRIPTLAAKLTTAGPGYRLTLGATGLDLVEFHAELQQAREPAGRPDEPSASNPALFHLDRALRLWRGPLLAGDGGLVIAAASTALEELRVSALEKYYELQLGAGFGRLNSLVGELRNSVADYPLRERLREQLMLALYFSGSRAEALDEYHSIRRLLGEAYGVDPGPSLASLYQRILLDDPQATETPTMSAGGHDAAAPPSAQPTLAAQVPNTIPYVLPDFAGRTAALQKIYSMSGAGDTVQPLVRVLVIEGMGGSGKSTLAIHAAHRLRGNYQGGEIYIDFKSYTPGADPLDAHTALGVALNALGIPEKNIPDSQAARTAAWRTATSSAPLLVLIDNAALSQDAAALIPNCPGSLVLVTSRDRISGLDGASSIRLDVFEPDESIELLERVLGRDRVAAEPAAAAELARLCGNLPLALRISAARLVNREHRSIAWLTQRLADETRRLDTLSTGERSVTASIRSSDQALKPEYRRALRLLSLYPGGSVGVPAACALLGRNEIETEEVLELLLDRHLLEVLPGGRFGIHDLVRAYAIQYMDVDGVSDAEQIDQATESLLSYFSVASGQASDIAFPGRNQYRERAPVYTGPAPAPADQAAAIAWFDAEYRNAHPLIRTASERGLHAHVAHISRNLAHYLHIRDHGTLLLKTAKLAEEACRALGSLPLLSNALVNLAIALWKDGQAEEGTVLLAEALTLAEQCDDRLGQAVCLGRLGAFQHTLGDNESAAAHLHRAITLSAELGRVREEIAARISLSSTLLALAAFEGAVSQATRAAELCVTDRESEPQIMALANLGKALVGCGRAKEAVSVLSKARGLIGTQREVTPRTALVLANLAEAYMEIGQAATAALYAEQAGTAVAEGKTAPALRTDALNTLGRVYRHLGETRTALECHTTARNLAHNSRYALGEATALVALAACCDDHGLERTYRAAADAIFDRYRVSAAVRDAR